MKKIINRQKEKTKQNKCFLELKIIIVLFAVDYYRSRNIGLFI